MQQLGVFAEPTIVNLYEDVHRIYEIESLEEVVVY